jgi:3-phenylpropionate/cinnamic acid dioxygenase small subunit
MAFEAQDYLDLLRLLQEHPEWRQELRRLLLTDELLALPQLFREWIEAQQRAERRTTRALLVLAQAQRRSEERIGRVEEQLAALAEAQRKTEERVTRVEEQLAALAEAQRKTEEQVRMLAEAQRHLEERVARVEEQLAALAEAQRKTEEHLAALVEVQRSMSSELSELSSRVSSLSDAVSGLRGRVLELTYQNKAVAYFGPLLRRVRVVSMETLLEALRAKLSPEEFRDVLLLDLLVQGKLETWPGKPEIWLAIEVSAVVDERDVERARRRATLLRRAGYRAIPVAAGERATLGAEENARQQSVVMLQDGRVFLWEEALKTWLASSG